MSEPIEGDVVDESVKLHMTETWSRDGLTWAVGCRCRWARGGYVSQHEARLGGDMHLVAMNIEREVLAEVARSDDGTQIGQG